MGLQKKRLSGLRATQRSVEEETRIKVEERAVIRAHQKRVK